VDYYWGISIHFRCRYAPIFIPWGQCSALA